MQEDAGLTAPYCEQTDGYGYECDEQGESFNNDAIETDPKVSLLSPCMRIVNINVQTI